MTDSMVERVARAMATSRLKRRLSPEFLAQMAAIEMLTCDNDDIEDARAAIEAMREPTNAMMDAAIATMPQMSIDGSVERQISRFALDAMITAALDTRDDGGKI